VNNTGQCVKALCIKKYAKQSELASLISTDHQKSIVRYASVCRDKCLYEKDKDKTKCAYAVWYKTVGSQDTNGRCVLIPYPLPPNVALELSDTPSGENNILVYDCTDFELTEESLKCETRPLNQETFTLNSGPTQNIHDCTYGCTEDKNVNKCVICPDIKKEIKRTWVSNVIGRFKILQFNMLAQALTGIDPKEKKAHKKFSYLVDWIVIENRRLKQIVNEILNSGADIVTMQENDRFHKILCMLNDKTFEEINHNTNCNDPETPGNKWNGIFFAKPQSAVLNFAGPADGLAIYWRNAKIGTNSKLIKNLQNKKRMDVFNEDTGEEGKKKKL
jgi:hypothetical protein